EIGAREVQVVLCTLHVAEEGIAAPAREEAIVTGLGNPCGWPRRDRCPFDDDVSAVGRRGGLPTLDTAYGRGLPLAFGGRESHAVCNIGDGIAVRVDLELVERFGGEGPGRSGSRRCHASRRMHVHNEDRPATVPRLGKHIQVKVQAGISVGKPEVGAGIVMRHEFGLNSVGRARRGKLLERLPQPGKTSYITFTATLETPGVRPASVDIMLEPRRSLKPSRRSGRTRRRPGDRLPLSDRSATADR